jgi:hypothetical protein
MTTDVPLDTDSRRLRTAIPPVAHPEVGPARPRRGNNRRRQCSDRTASLRYINFRHRARQQLKPLFETRVKRTSTGPGGVTRGDPSPHAGADPDRGVEVDGHSGLIAPRDCLHRGDVHEGREAHVRPGSQDPDPSRLFNSSLEGNTRRAIDIQSTRARSRRS